MPARGCSGRMGSSAAAAAFSGVARAWEAPGSRSRSLWRTCSPVPVARSCSRCARWWRRPRGVAARAGAASHPMPSRRPRRTTRRRQVGHSPSWVVAPSRFTASRGSSWRRFVRRSWKRGPSWCSPTAQTAQPWSSPRPSRRDRTSIRAELVLRWTYLESAEIRIASAVVDHIRVEADMVVDRSVLGTDESATEAANRLTTRTRGLHRRLARDFVRALRASSATSRALAQLAAPAH